MNQISLVAAVLLSGLLGCGRQDAPGPSSAAVPLTALSPPPTPAPSPTVKAIGAPPAANSKAPPQPQLQQPTTATSPAPSPPPATPVAAPPPPTGDPNDPHLIAGYWPHEFTVSPDGRWWAWETERAAVRTVYLYSIAERRVAASLPLESGLSSGYRLAFSPDSKRLFANQSNKEAKSAIGLYEVPDLKPTSLSQTIDESRIDGVSFSPDGAEVLLAAGFGIYRWDLAANKVTEPKLPSTIDNGRPHDVGDERRFVAINDGDLIVLSRSDWKERKRWSTGSTIHRFTVAPGAKWGATFARDAKLVTVWDTVAGTLVKELPHPKELRFATFSGDGKWLLTNSGDGAVNLWSGDDWTLRGTFPAHSNRVTALVALPGSASFLTVGNSDDPEQSAVKRWDLAEVVAKLPAPVAAEPVVPTLAADSFGTEFGNYHQVCGFTDAGRSLFTMDVHGVLKVYDATGKPEPKWTLDLGRKARWADFTADGRRFAAGFVDDEGAVKTDERVGFVNIYDAKSRKLERTLKLESSIPAHLRFSPDGKSLAVGAGNAFPETGELSLWDVEQGTRTASLAKGDSRVKRVAFSSSGKLLASAAYREATVWDLATGAARFKLKYEKGIEDLAFSPDEKWLAVASGGDEDGRVAVFDLSNGTRTSWFDSFTEKALAVAFSPASDRLVVVCHHKLRDASYQIREIPGGKLLGRLSAAGTKFDTGSATFAPDGSLFASCVFDGTRVWRGLEFLDPRLQVELAKLKDRGVRIEERDGRLVVDLSDANDRVLQEFPILSCPFALDLSSADAVTDAGLAHLAKQPQLVELELPDEKITPAGLAQLKDLPLRRLDTGSIFFERDEDLRVLGEFRQLEELRLVVDSDQKPLDLAPLAKTGRLRRLSITWYSVPVASLRSLASLPQLETLNLDGYTVFDTDDELKYLAPLKRLRSLKFSAEPEVTGAGLKHLAGAVELETLDLEGCRGITNEAVAQLRPFKRLKNLDLRDAKVDAPGFAPLAELTELEYLRLPEGVTDDHLAHLAGLTKLRELDLAKQAVTDAGLAKLDRLTALTKLELAGVKGVTGNGLAAFAGAQDLKKLSLDSCAGLTDEGLAGVAKLTQLELLRLPKQIGDAGLERLAPLKNLTWFEAKGSKITPAAAKKFEAGFPARQLSIFEPQ